MGIRCTNTLNYKPYLEQKISGFNEFWSQRIKFNIRNVKIPIIPLRKTPKTLPNRIIISVMANCFLDITVKYLKGRISLSNLYPLVEIEEVT